MGEAKIKPNIQLSDTIFLYMRIRFTNIGKNTRLYSLQVDISIPGGPQQIDEVRTKRGTKYKQTMQMKAEKNQ